jgi:hypothetical protein
MKNKKRDRPTYVDKKANMMIVVGLYGEEKRPLLTVQGCDTLFIKAAYPRMKVEEDYDFEIQCILYC